MTNELGKIERPEAAPFKIVRKLYLVPLIFCPRDAPEDFQELCRRYWLGVNSSLESLETRAGNVVHIYHESVFLSGAEGLQLVERMSSSSYEIMKPRCEGGARLEALEDLEEFGEYMDWQRCLMIGLMSHKVASQVSEHYVEASRRRYENMTKRIQESLGQQEAGLLFISEGHKVQFPPDIEVFYVAPPALDEIHRWQRDAGQKSEAEHQAHEHAEE